MHHHPERRLVELTYTKLTQVKNYLSLDTLIEQPPNSEHANGSVTQMKIGQQPPYVYEV